MKRHVADILDFVKPWREKLLRQADERLRHIDPQHDAMIAEHQALEKDDDATPRP
jgi:hypothetical protein